MCERELAWNALGRNSPSERALCGVGEEYQPRGGTGNTTLVTRGLFVVFFTLENSIRVGRYCTGVRKLYTTLI